MGQDSLEKMLKQVEQLKQKDMTASIDVGCLILERRGNNLRIKLKQEPGCKEFAEKFQKLIQETLGRGGEVQVELLFEG